MSQLAQLLNEKAEELRLSDSTEVAVDHLKQAGLSEEDARLHIAQHIMEKEATNALVQAGVDIEKAVSMVKAAGTNLKDLVTYESIPVINPSVELLKQAALYIESLEDERNELLEKLEKVARDAEYDEIVLPKQITKVASSGAFTNEDLAKLQKMDQGVLTKLASVMEEPWGMGSGSGPSFTKTDPLLEFMLNG